MFHNSQRTSLCLSIARRASNASSRCFVIITFTVVNKGQKYPTTHKRTSSYVVRNRFSCSERLLYDVSSRCALKKKRKTTNVWPGTEKNVNSVSLDTRRRKERPDLRAGSVTRRARVHGLISKARLDRSKDRYTARTRPDIRYSSTQDSSQCTA